MTRSPFACLLFSAAALLAGPPAVVRADPPPGVTFSYDLFVPGGQTPVSNILPYTPGQNLTVQVYLTQTGGPSNYLAGEGGLFQGGARMTFGSPSGVIAVPSVNNIVLNTTATDPPDTSAFNDPVTSNATRQVTANFAQFSPSTDASYGVLPDASGRILLATVTFTTNVAGGTTTLIVDDIPPPFTDNLTLAATDLDPAVGPASFTVIPAPEPAGILAAAAAGAAAVAARRRRRRPPQPGPCEAP